MILRLLQTYLALSVIAVLIYIGFAGRAGLDHNKDAQYCDYYVSAEEANFHIGDDRCRIRPWFYVKMGLIAAIILVIIQSPAYVCLIVRHIYVRRRSKKPDP